MFNKYYQTKQRKASKRSTWKVLKSFLRRKRKKGKKGSGQIWNLSEKEKEKKRRLHLDQNRNLSEKKKKKCFEYMRNYYLTYKTDLEIEDS